MSTEQNKARVYKHLQLVVAPLAEPDQLTGHINIEQRKAAIYCDICTPPNRIAELVDAHADEIAEWLDAWEID
jgi:hypothetical protein